MATIEYLGKDNEDLYSDGDQVELDILNYVKTTPQEEYRKLLSEDVRWAVFYHLSDMRENILNWYDFKPNCDVLEIGGGMGAITGLLCRKAGTVTTVELTKRRASVIYERHKQCDNLRILAGNFNDIEFDRKFDYITLIGVLEYAKGFVSSGKAEDFLVKIRSLLKPDGKLLIAIENRFGMKYWCGAAEDHLAKPFAGINGYIGVNNIETYSRKDLNLLLKRCGFPEMRFYYPLPDYKFPQVMYSDEFLPGESSTKNLTYYYIGTSKLVSDEATCYRAAVQNGAFPFMANSFFVECAADSTAELSNVIFSTFTPERIREHRTLTKIRSDKTVEKCAACPEAEAHLNSILEGQKHFSGDALIGYRRQGDHLEMELIDGEPLNTALRDALLMGNIQAAKSLLDMLYDAILASAGDLPSDADTLPCGFLDMIVSNCFIVDGKLRFFDQEWRQDNASPRYILYRAIRYFFAEHPEIRSANAMTFFRLYHYSADEMAAFEEAEAAFQQSVCPMQNNPLHSLAAYQAPIDYDGQHAERQLAALQQQYDTISNARLWKISAPLRKVLDQIKMRKRARSGKRTLLHEAYTFYRSYGLRATLDKTKSYLGLRKATKSKFLGGGWSEQLDSIAPISQLSGEKKIAVHLHLYYVDLLEEFCTFLSNIPFPFDLFVSVRQGADLAAIKARLHDIPNAANVRAEFCENRGRDIAPLFVQFGKDIQKYDYFLHIHTKKSLYTGIEKKDWRQYSIKTLLGDETTVRKIFSMLENKDWNVGLVFPETVGLPTAAHDWLQNKQIARALLSSIGMELEDGYFNYPTGSFYWARTEALMPLFKRGLTLGDFPQEAGQIDGTLAHALERAVAVVARNRGYHNAIIDPVDDVVRFDISLKLFSDYFALTVDTALRELFSYEIVSFDIFDTLITRKIFCPDDIFRLIGSRIRNTLGVHVDFPKVRKLAEKMVWKEKGAATSIREIYAALPDACPALAAHSEQIMQWEIEAEKDLCVPRKDMVSLYHKLQNMNKRLFLISDMYLPKDVLADLLAANGIDGYETLLVSCDLGLRKDDGSLWQAFFDQHPNISTRHVGDNPESDMQRVADCNRLTFLIMNPVSGWKMTKMYPAFADLAGADRSMEASVMLGLIIQNRLFNSPFAQNADGQIVITQPADFGYAAFGPLFTYFTEWLCEKTQGRKKLFLAREGYVFRQFYDLYCSIFDLSSADGIYLLTSRRAASVAAAETADDIAEILSEKYNGSLHNLLKTRLGFDLNDKNSEISVTMPNQLDKVMYLLQPHMEQILQKAAQERAAYLAYLSETAGDFAHAVLVDVGYSGTIQYYLSKLLKQKIDGCYLAASPNRKPEKLGCTCESAFPLDSWADEPQNVVFMQQKFLESLLKAPFGQLTCFAETDGNVLPQYNADSEVPDGISEMIRGALEYAGDYWRIAKKYALSFEGCREPAVQILEFMLHSGIMSREVGALFSFDDAFRSNGSFRYNTETDAFELITR